MGLGTIPARTNGQTIADTWFNVIRTALGADIVPRDAAGIVTDIGGSLGSTSYAWLYAYLTQLKMRSNSNYVTFKAPAALAANYDLITPPALPASQKSGLTLDTNGQMGVFGITGIIAPYGGTTAPTGWLLCDGTSYLRADYPDLYEIIAGNFGTADGTHFNVPDLRGRFLRGWDNAAGRDPNAATRTAMATGGSTGDNVGSVQSDATKKNGLALTDPGHGHGMTVTTASGLQATAVQGTNTLSGTANINTNTTGITLGSGDSETRPLNANVAFIIKT